MGSDLRESNMNELILIAGLGIAIIGVIFYTRRSGQQQAMGKTCYVCHEVIRGSNVTDRRKGVKDHYHYKCWVDAVKGVLFNDG